MKRIKVLGITGGLGAGKSTVLAYLRERYGAETLELDRAAHRLMEPQGSCFWPLVEAFGDGIVKDGRISRASLYEKAFVDDGRRNVLNAIVHPRVKEYAKEWIARQREAQTAPFLVLEAALLLEDHYEQICDEIWYIRINDEARAARLLETRGYSSERLRQIVRAQKSDGEFLAACDFVVDNSTDDLKNTYEQIDRGIREHEFV